MDGFKTWRTLFENGVSGIIRGDEGFGWVPVSTLSDVKRSIGISLCSDFVNLRDYTNRYFPTQILPSAYERKEGESLELWRDRLYHQYRIPAILAALNDLKLPYVEIVNPLLSRRIIYHVRTLPDKLRTDKYLYRQIVLAISPKISFAKYSGIETEKNILKSGNVVQYLIDELSSDYACDILSKEFTKYICDNMEILETKKRESEVSLKGRLKPFVPSWLKSKIQTQLAPPKIDINVLAFRAYTICKMNQMLVEDSRSLPYSGSDLSGRYRG